MIIDHRISRLKIQASTALQILYASVTSKLMGDDLTAYTVLLMTTYTQVALPNTENLRTREGPYS